MHNQDLGGEQSAFTNPKILELVQTWRSRLKRECPEQSAANQECIIHWLLGDLKQCETLDGMQLEAQQAITYRYWILRQHYLGVAPKQAYRHLMTRLGSLVLRWEKIRNLIGSNCDRQCFVLDILQEVLQELINSDREIQQQISQIAKCNDAGIRNALLLASLEEYCLRPIHNQPLLIYHLINYLQCRVQEQKLTPRSRSFAQLAK